jgi:hypothetical protein
VTAWARLAGEEFRDRESYGNDGSDGKPGKPTPGFPPFPQILGNLADDARFHTFPQLRRRMFLLEQKGRTEGRLHKILDTAGDCA